MRKLSLFPPQAVTSAPTFSFYLRSYEASAIDLARRFGQAITLAGPKGPEIGRGLRRAGFTKPMLFDGEGYKGKVTDIDDWLNTQQDAEADRLLLPGVFLEFSQEVTGLVRRVREQATIARLNGAVMVLALDAQWVGVRTRELIDVLQSAGVPVALVLGHRTDPLSAKRNVAGLRAITLGVPDLVLLRTDHGGFGALAYGAAHVSVGLAPGTRHLALGGGRPASTSTDDSPRVFVRDAMAWHRASKLLAWEEAGVKVPCALPCCGGRSLGRFFTKGADSMVHNVTALDDLGSVILAAPAGARPAVFKAQVSAAIKLYVHSGSVGFVKPGPQLMAWALA